MTVNNIPNINNISFDKISSTFDQAAGKVTEKKQSSFDSFFEAAMNVIDETNQYQINADNAQLDFISGKTDDILSVALAQDMAYTSMNFTVQVTNKIIEAYREIMRMQL